MSARRLLAILLFDNLASDIHDFTIRFVIQLDEKTVRHVAHLARIAITDAEVTLYREQLSTILAYVSQLTELDTSDVPPSEHSLSTFNVLRADRPHQSWTPDDALKNAPDRHGDFFRVPKVLDQEGA